MQPDPFKLTWGGRSPFHGGGARSFRPAVAAFTVALLALTTLAAGARLLGAASPTPPPASRTGTQSPPANSQNILQTVRFTLYAEGLYPREARVRAGRVVVALTDYTGGSAGLVVERETHGVGPPERAGLAARSGAHWRGRQEMRLAPGRYKVYDASRPENTAALVIEQ